MSHIEPISAPAMASPRSGENLSRPLARLWLRVDRFFFRPTSPTNLGFCRMLFFLGVLAFHMPRDLTTWAAVPKNYWHPIALFRVLHLTVLTYSHTRLVVRIWKWSLVLSCLGLLTRPANWVALVVGIYVLGLPHNFGKVGHGDPVLIFTMLILAVSRCGNGFSIDSLIRRFFKKLTPSPDTPGEGRGEGLATRAKKALTLTLSRHTGRGDREDMRVNRARPSGEYTWPIRMEWVLLSLVFCAAGATKLIRSGLPWITSDNLEILLLQHYFALKTPTSLGLMIAHHPLLCKILAGMSVATELLFPLALFSRRLRVILVPAAFLMQIGIGLAMGVYFTQFMICYLFWVPWQRIGRWVVTTVRRRQ